MTVAELSSCSRNWVASKIKNILFFSFLQKKKYLLIPGLGTVYFLCFLISTTGIKIVPRKIVKDQMIVFNTVPI